jgi:hypothetical protein
MPIWRVPKNGNFIRNPNITAESFDMLVITRFEKHVWETPLQFSDSRIQAKVLENILTAPNFRQVNQGMHC